MHDIAVPRNLRVLEIGTNWFSPGSGGLDRVFHDLVLSLPRVGVDARGLVLGPPDVAGMTDGRVAAFGRPGASMPERLWRARRYVRDSLAAEKFDLFAAHFAMFAAPALGQLRHMPFAFHFHGPWADESRTEGGNGLSVAGKRVLEKLVYRRADRVIVLSRAFAHIAQHSYGVAEDRLRIVPGSVDVPRFDTGLTRDEARTRLGWPRDRRIMLAVRRLAARMGLDRLIAAMSVIKAAVPDALLMIAGKGHMAKTLAAQVEAAGLADHVRFLGFLPDSDLPFAYRAAEFNVVPTLALEGFGLTTIEALAAGTPSFVSPVGALPEVVSGLSPDLIFESTEPGPMAARLIAALRGEIAVPDAQSCAEYASARYNALHSAECTAAVYREIV